MAFRRRETDKCSSRASLALAGALVKFPPSTCTLDSTAAASWTSDQGTREPGNQGTRARPVCLRARAGQGSLALAGDLVEISPSTCTLVSTAPASWTSDQGTRDRPVCLRARAGQGSLALAGGLVKISKYKVPGLDCPGQLGTSSVGPERLRPGQARPGRPAPVCLPSHSWDSREQGGNRTLFYFAQG